MAEEMPGNNAQIAQGQTPRNLKLAGIILLCVSVPLQFMTWFTGYMTVPLSLIGWLVGILGTGLYTKGEWSIGWVIIAAIPVFGSPMVLVAIAVDSLLAKCTVGNFARRAAALAIAVAGIGILAAVVIPAYLNYPMTSRQGEARASLRSIWQAEKSFYSTHKRYGTFEEIGFKPTGTRYTFRIDRTGKSGTVIKGFAGGPDAFDNSVVPPGFSATGFTATATANLDNDPTLDQWHINDAEQGLDKADVDDVRK